MNRDTGASSPNPITDSKHLGPEPNPQRDDAERLSQQIHIFSSSLGIYVVLTALTREIFYGDTPFYILSIINYSGGRNFFFWDFGHLLWRPANWALLHAIHRLLPSLNMIALLFWIMVSLNWMAGLGCVLLVARVARRFVSALYAVLAALTLAVSQVFLNYLHTGTAYVPGLFFLFLGLDFAPQNPSLHRLSGVKVVLLVRLWPWRSCFGYLTFLHCLRCSYSLLSSTGSNGSLFFTS